MDAAESDLESEQEGEQEGGGDEQGTPRMQMEGQLDIDSMVSPASRASGTQRLSVSGVNAVLVEAPALVDPTFGVNGGEDSLATPPP
jgi:hypothetical protein